MSSKRKKVNNGNTVKNNTIFLPNKSNHTYDYWIGDEKNVPGYQNLTNQYIIHDNVKSGIYKFKFSMKNQYENEYRSCMIRSGKMILIPLDIAYKCQDKFYLWMSGIILKKLPYQLIYHPKIYFQVDSNDYYECTWNITNVFKIKFNN